MFQGKRVSLVLGGGGLKGLAHIGVLKVLARYGIVPDEYVGTSVGSIVAALAAGGLMPEEIERIALQIRKPDILDYDWKGLLLRRGRVRSLYCGRALRAWLQRTLPVTKFDQMMKPAYFATVDINGGQFVVWGRAGFCEPQVDACVAASCAIPGIYPPVEIAGRYYMDGSLMDTLPIRVATAGKGDLIIAVYLEELDRGAPRSVQRLGIGAILEQAQAIVSQTILRLNLNRFDGAPIVLIQPRVRSHGMFQFDRTESVIRAGEDAALKAIASEPELKGATLLEDTPAPGTLRPPHDTDTRTQRRFEA
jgi:NTE family protein